MTNSHFQWMQDTLAFAKTAIAQGEVPIAAILVSKHGEIAREFTRVSTHHSMAAHAETLMLLEAQIKPFTDYQPLTLYCTLEPCLMCLGAAINCGVETIVYAMPAHPDGGTRFVTDLKQAGRPTPLIVPNILRIEAEQLMQGFLREHPNHTGVGYVQSLFAE